MHKTSVEPSARKSARNVCRRCGAHRAVSTYRGRTCHRPQHDLCPRCWRAAIDSLRAARLTSVPDPRPGREEDA
jgi:hypothetical protein